MNTQRWKTTLTALLLGGAILALPSPAAAHCDSMDGPVVEAARRALESGDLDPVLAWVGAGDEPEIRSAFDRTLRVRAAGGEARELADRWFFETVVRIHRDGEGAPYTGLKPAGNEVPAGIAAADRALETGTGDAMVEAFAGHVAEVLAAKLERTLALRAYDPADVEAGRAYVHAYVDYIHFVEHLHELLRGGAHGHDQR